MTISSVPLAIGLDLGGSKIAGGVVDLDAAIVERLATFPTEPRSPEETLRTIVEIVAAVRGRHPVAGVGIGVAGLVDRAGAMVVQPRIRRHGAAPPGVRRDGDTGGGGQRRQRGRLG